MDKIEVFIYNTRSDEPKKGDSKFTEHKWLSQSSHAMYLPHSRNALKAFVEGDVSWLTPRQRIKSSKREGCFSRI